MAEETRLIREVRQRPEGAGWGEQARIARVSVHAPLPANAVEVPAGVAETDWKEASEVPEYAVLPTAPLVVTPAPSEGVN